VSALALTNPPKIDREGDDLEAILHQLQSYGEPRCVMLNNGWYCAVDMYVSAIGANFKVASEFSHPTPRAAAQECRKRVLATLESMGKSK